MQLICHRWGEENAIKELLHKHLINYTPGYVSEELEPQPLVDISGASDSVNAWERRHPCRRFAFTFAA